MKSLFSAALLLTALSVGTPASAHLITTYSTTGNVGVEVTAFARNGGISPSTGVLTLSNIPTGAVIERAYVYASVFSLGAGGFLNFNGTLVPGVQHDVNAVTTSSVARWDVTSLITGNGNYSTSDPLSNDFGLALAVVFNHPNLPLGSVCLNDGLDAVGPGIVGPTAFTLCQGLDEGPGRLWIHTVGDNATPPGGVDDKILLNGVQVASPIDANLGDFASLFDLAVTFCSRS